VLEVRIPRKQSNSTEYNST